MVEASFITSAGGTNVSVTRVENSNWFTSDMVGIRMSGTGILDRFTGYKKFSPETAGTTVNLIPTADDQKLCYPTNGSTVTFTAFCPYDSSQNPDGGTVSYTLFSQTTSAAMEAVDLIYHTGATGSKSSPEVPLVFTHKFSKLTINVVCGTEVTNLGVALNNLNMTITNVPTAAVCTLADGTVAVSSVGPVSPYLQNLAATGKASAIIAPHAGGGDYTDRAITFKVGDLDYSYILPSDFEFEAAKEYTFNFTLTLTAPILTESTITDWTGGTIAWDGEGYKLTAPTEVVHYRQATTGNTIVIKTNHVNTPGIQYSTDATTVTGSSTVKGYLTQTKFEKTNDTSPYEWTLTYDMVAATADREGYIHVSVAGMTVVTKVTQKAEDEFPAPVLIESDGDANCFIVPPGNSMLIFDAQRAFSGETGDFPTTDDLYVDILWDDNQVLNYAIVKGEVDNASIIATTNPRGNVGNALIALRNGDANGDIYWSWHIWVTDINESEVWHNTSSTGNRTKFMDRNLGARKAGSLATSKIEAVGNYYQWGRKDPFSAWVPYSQTAGKVTQTVAHQHPTTFYTNTQNWLSTNVHTLWGGNTTTATKTIYDPCPAGWRVPLGTANLTDADNVWNGVTNNVADGKFNWGGTNGIFWVTGYISNSSAQLYLLYNNIVQYWTATKGGQNYYSYPFYYSGSTFGIYGNGDLAIRARGAQIRCVVDE